MLDQQAVSDLLDLPWRLWLSAPQGSVALSKHMEAVVSLNRLDVGTARLSGEMSRTQSKFIISSSSCISYVSYPAALSPKD